MTGILIIYYEPRPAGQTTHVLSLSRGLERSGYHVTVVLPEHLEHAIAALAHAGCAVVPLPMGKLAWAPSSILTLASLVRSGGFDIVHVHSQEAGVVARPLARLAGARHIIYTPQTIDIRRTGGRWLYTRIERLLARFTDAIISVNGPDRDRLISWGIPGHKVITISNGIDLEALGGPVDVPRLRRSLALPEAHPLVVQMGRLSAQKDPLAFVECAAAVLRECPDTLFALVGEGPLKDTLGARIRGLDLEKQVRLLGWQAGGDRLIAAADVVTLTSRWEGTPYALLEAMAWSRPVVATAVNGCREVVQEGVTGFLVPAGDVSSLSQRVTQLLRDPALGAAMGCRGRQHVEANYSLQDMIAQVQRLYDRLMEEEPSTSRRRGSRRGWS